MKSELIDAAMAAKAFRNGDPRAIKLRRIATAMRMIVKRVNESELVATDGSSDGQVDVEEPGLPFIGIVFPISDIGTIYSLLGQAMRETAEDISEERVEPQLNVKNRQRKSGHFSAVRVTIDLGDGFDMDDRRTFSLIALRRFADLLNPLKEETTDQPPSKGTP